MSIYQGVATLPKIDTLTLDELHGADGTQEEDGGHLDPWDHGRNLGEMLQDLNGL